MTEPTDPAAPLPLPWPQLMVRWPDLTGPQRRRCLAAWAEGLREAAQRAIDPTTLPPELWMLVPDQRGRLRASPPPHLARASIGGATPQRLQAALTDWMQALQRWVPLREAAALADRVLRGEPLSRAHRRDVLRTIARRAQRAQRRLARGLYEDALRHPRVRMQGKLAGCWLPDPAVGPDHLAVELARIETDPATVCLKRTPDHVVLRATLLGQNAIIKRFRPASPLRRLLYRGRASRARRAWAAAHTLGHLNLPTAAPLGFLETGPGDVCYLLTEDLAEARSMFDWLHTGAAALPADPVRRGVARDLLRSWTDLERAGLYHADTKLSNVLVLHPDDAERRTFYWIDLECLRAGALPTKRRLVRNLVQLNGSLRRAATLRERLRFLREAAGRHPWMYRRGTMARIASWTARRLSREDRGLCGP